MQIIVVKVTAEWRGKDEKGRMDNQCLLSDGMKALKQSVIHTINQWVD